eukprot:COSAG04_NODE_3977_length_2386_cov_1.610407_1_plen_258_part_10
MAKAAHWMELDDKRKAKEGDGVGAGAAAASGTVGSATAPDPADPAAVALLRQVCEQRHLFHVVLSFGSVADLCRWRAVNTSWRSAATESDLWAPRCKRLWADKVYVAPRARELLAAKKAMAAYGLAVEDSRRTSITIDELCSFTWTHRMKGWSGSEWTDSCPWWTGQGTPRTRRFQPDGTTITTAAGETLEEPATAATAAAEDMLILPGWMLRRLRVESNSRLLLQSSIHFESNTNKAVRWSEPLRAHWLHQLAPRRA